MPEGSKGYVAGQQITAEGSEPDGPTKNGTAPKTINADTKWMVFCDGPGFPFKKDYKLPLPASYKANFYLVVTSKTDKKVKAQIWYDVVIVINDKGEATTNEVKLTKSRIGQ